MAWNFVKCYNVKPGVFKFVILCFIFSIRRRQATSWGWYLNGGCYYFYGMLKERFPHAEAYYDSNHIIIKIDDAYYDITGEVEKKKHANVEQYYSHKELEKEFKYVYKPKDIKND